MLTRPYNSAVNKPTSTNVVVAPNQDQHHHGQDPQAPGWSLCGAVPVTDDLLRDLPFTGDRDNDCTVCASKLADAAPSDH